MKQVAGHNPVSFLGQYDEITCFSSLSPQLIGKLEQFKPRKLYIQRMENFRVWLFFPSGTQRSPTPAILSRTTVALRFTILNHRDSLAADNGSRKHITTLQSATTWKSNRLYQGARVIGKVLDNVYKPNDTCEQQDNEYITNTLAQQTSPFKTTQVQTSSLLSAEVCLCIPETSHYPPFLVS